MANDLNFVIKNGLNVKEEAHIADFLDADGLRYPENQGAASQYDVIVLTDQTITTPDPTSRDAGAVTTSKVLQLQRLNLDNISDGSGAIQPDGLTHQFFTQERVWNSLTLVDNTIVNEDNPGDPSFTYNSATGTFTYFGPSSNEIRQYIQAGTGTHYDQGTGTVSIGQPVETTSNVTFADATLTGDLVGPSVFCIDPGGDGIPGGQVVIKGDLRVDGTTTTLNTTELAVEDNIVILNSNVTGTPSVDAGLEVERGSLTNVRFIWDESEFYWTTGIHPYHSTGAANDSKGFIGNLDGNADTATEWASPLTLNLTGDASGSVSFDGNEGSVNLAVSVDGTQHDHVHSHITDWDAAVEATVESILTSETGFNADEIDISAGAAGEIVLGHGTTSGGTPQTSYRINTNDSTKLTSAGDSKTLATRIDGRSESTPGVEEGGYTGSETYPDGGTVIQHLDVKFDEWGHMLDRTVKTTNLDDRYYTKFALEDEFVNESGDRMTGNLKFQDNVYLMFGDGDDSDDWTLKGNPNNAGATGHGDFYISHDGASANIENYTGDMIFTQHNNTVATVGDYVFKIKDSSINANYNILTLEQGGGMTVIHNGTVDNDLGNTLDNVVLSTDANGVNIGSATSNGLLDVYGSINVVRDGDGTDANDSGSITMGTDNDLAFWHDGTDSFICNSTGELYIESDGITMRSKTGSENYLTADVDGAVQLYYNNEVKLTTDNEGVNVTDRLDVAGTSHLIDDVFIGPEPHAGTVFPTQVRSNTTTGQQIFHFDVSAAELSIGKNDDTRGLINLFGRATGANGGRFRMFNSGDYDRWTYDVNTNVASEYWHLMSSYGEFKIAFDNELRHTQGWGESTLIGAKPFEGAYLNYGSVPSDSKFDDDTFADGRRFQTTAEGTKTVGDHCVTEDLFVDNAVYIGHTTDFAVAGNTKPQGYAGLLDSSGNKFSIYPSLNTGLYDSTNALYFDRDEILTHGTKWTANGGFRVKDSDLEVYDGNLLFDGVQTGTDQGNGIYWRAFDKETINDRSDEAHIRHTTNIGGFTGSVLEIRSMNDSTDGITLTTDASSYVTHNSHRLFTDDYHPNADVWTTARLLTLAGDLTGQVSIDGSGDVTLTVAVVDNSHNHVHTDISDWDEAVEDKIGTKTAGGTMIDQAYNDTNGVTTFTHSDTSTLNGAYGQTGTEDGTYIKSITVDDRGHLTAITTDDFDDRYDYYDYWTIAASDTAGTANVSTTNTVTFTSGDYQTITRSGTEIIVTGEKGNYVAGNGISLTSTGSTGDRTIEWSGTYTGNVAITGDVSVTGDISATGTVCSTSDRRVKDNIKTIENALDKVDNLRGVSYTKDGKTEVGVIAQEVEEVVPEVVQTNEAGMKSVAYGNLVGVLIESVKELKAEIEDLRSQLNSKNGDE
jgi:hypothetical protein